MRRTDRNREPDKNREPDGNRGLAGWLHHLSLWIWRLPLPEWLRRVLMWTGNPKFVVTSAAVVINARGEVLLFHHTYRGDEPWGLPGGWLKRAEDPAAAIEREILEESGLTVRVLRPLWVGRETTLPRLDIVFLTQIVDGEFRPSAEVDACGYFTRDNLPELSPGVRRLLISVMEEGIHR